MDYIKFALQACFGRSLRVIKPFEHIHRRLIAKRQARAAVPDDVARDLIEQRRAYVQQISLRSNAEEKQPTAFDYVTEFGSSFYVSYTEPLAALRKLNPLVQQSSSNKEIQC